MAAKKFELFIGYLGNGATVCNKAVMEHGEYKYIAHISSAGNIKFYVDESYIPDSDMKRITNTAEGHRSKITEKLDRELKCDYGYHRILDEICEYTPWSESDKLLDDLKKVNEKEKKIALIKNYYLKWF